MSEAEKTIIFESNKRYPPGSTTNNLWFVFREGAEFGYQLGYEQGGRDAVEYFMKTIYEDTLRRYSVPMAAESKEPKP